MAEAEVPGKSGLDAPVERRIGALEALAAMPAGARCALVLIHFAPLAAVAWGHTRVQAAGHTGSPGRAQDAATNSDCGHTDG